ncbi:MAG: chorismate mutase [Clostridiales bacterium]|nr:chorismate mutase [Clostridiales bacterium]
MDDIKKLREEIDSVDTKLVQLFERRMEIVLKIAEYKKLNNMKVFDRSREDEVIKKGIGLLKNEAFKEPTKDFLIDMMKISKDIQHGAYPKKDAK